ncbi:hypothetical protein [Marinilactibacillus kalidii]|uniref:hypothetical protein n=1 Tax=Marinilactibacillus kalidii TaxID=2820274 RepID=UPI001ABEA9E5|nr:hypothetical protein [Marinilactibacillus kalidii]
MNLTARIYLLEYLSGMIFYSIGIFLITPPTDPAFVKYIFVGGMLLILVGIWINTYLKKTDKLDERGLNNLFKASSVTILILLFLLLLSGIILLLVDIHLIFSSGIISFILAIIFIIHATTFRTLEIKGD